MASSNPSLVRAVVRWYGVHERPLPWRATTPWGVVVSEFMLQQTPVSRVLPVWDTWLQRWPTPIDLAASPPAEVIRAWGRLGYPRRAQRLQLTASALVVDHNGQVPDDEDALRTLPGVGEYTAAAIRAFAFGRRSLVLDTNVRRVLSRALDGQAFPPGHITTAERVQADTVWPRSDAASARWSAAVMELGALVCTAGNPDCSGCPIRRQCAWHAAGHPASAQQSPRQPPFHGSDRQARGRLLAVLRDSDRSVAETALLSSWPDDAEQAARALAGLLADGLAVRKGRRISLPQ